jgi:hypothetical protein
MDYHDHNMHMFDHSRAVGDVINPGQVSGENDDNNRKLLGVIGESKRSNY